MTSRHTGGRFDGRGPCPRPPKRDAWGIHQILMQFEGQAACCGMPLRFDWTFDRYLRECGLSWNYPQLVRVTSNNQSETHQREADIKWSHQISLLSQGRREKQSRTGSSFLLGHQATTNKLRIVIPEHPSNCIDILRTVAGRWKRTSCMIVTTWFAPLERFGSTTNKNFPSPWTRHAWILWVMRHEFSSFWLIDSK